MFLTTVTILFWTCLIQDGQATVFESRIQNGESTERDEIPYVVSLQSTDSEHFCGGSILNEEYVLTAAHCINNSGIQLRPERIRVTTGYNTILPASVHSVIWVLQHKYYVNGGANFNDIALLKLDTISQLLKININATILNKCSCNQVTPLFIFNEHIAPVTLPKPYFEVAPGTKALLVGWGQTVTKKFRNETTKPQILQKLSLSIARENYCREQYMSKIRNIYTTHLCTVIPYGVPKSACTGDSGDPLTIGQNLIVGIASTSPQNDYHCSEYPTVYTKVSHYIHWISRHTIGIFNKETKKHAALQYYENNVGIIFPSD